VASIISVIKTYLPQVQDIKEAKIRGMLLGQILQAGHWNQSILCQAYLTYLPCQFMRVITGFLPSAGNYFLVRAAHEPLYVTAGSRQWYKGSKIQENPMY
jgi:hypothetical protein